MVAATAGLRLNADVVRIMKAKALFNGIASLDELLPDMEKMLSYLFFLLPSVVQPVIFSGMYDDWEKSSLISLQRNSPPM